VLGDNIFFGHGLPEILAQADARTRGGTVFGYHVADPERYGVVDFTPEGRARAIVEKPELPPSNYAVTGLYFLDASAPERARHVRPSARGELEIATLLEDYLAEDLLRVEKMGRGLVSPVMGEGQEALHRRLRRVTDHVGTGGGQAGVEAVDLVPGRGAVLRVERQGEGHQAEDERRQQAGQDGGTARDHAPKRVARGGVPVSGGQKP